MRVESNQVVPDFVSEAEIRAQGGDAQDAMEARQEAVKRQLVWLKRKRTGEAKDLRPRKRHRRSTFVWIMCLHNQVRKHI